MLVPEEAAITILEAAKNMWTELIVQVVINILKLSTMKIKLLLLFIFSFSFLAQIEAQRRTTSVRGYTRKDGTYVKPHTRSYNSGNGYSSSSYGSANLGSTSSEENYSYKNLAKDEENSDSRYLLKTSDYNGETIELSKLNAIQNTDTTNEEGNIIYISVLYYNGKIIDICPITKGYGSWSFNNIYHSFNRNKITSDDALELITNYGWEIHNEKIGKSYKFELNSDKKLPNCFTKKIEALKLKP